MKKAQEDAQQEPGWCERLGVVVCQGGDRGYVLYTPEEWACTIAADLEADADGTILFQGTPNGERLTADEMRRAQG
jgi:hypothetical protein